MNNFTYTISLMMGEFYRLDEFIVNNPSSDYLNRLGKQMDNHFELMRHFINERRNGKKQKDLKAELEEFEFIDDKLLSSITRKKTENLKEHELVYSYLSYCYDILKILFPRKKFGFDSILPDDEE